MTAIKSRGVGASRHYYVLAARGTAVLVYDAEGKLVTRIPPPAPPEAARAGQSQPSLQYGDDLDIGCAPAAQAKEVCFLYVADRGANAIKVFTAEGTLARTIPVTAPTSVVVLAEGEVAVATMRALRLVNVFDANGKMVREFGVPTELTPASDLNRFLNIGRLATDSASHIYYSFSYLPEPTLRKYDRFGFAALEIELATLDFQTTAQATRREIARQESRPGRGPALNPVATAIAVDPETQEIWLALGGLLLHFDREGHRRATYRTFTAEGARLEAAALLVEPERLLVASETLGIFDFPRPDKLRR